MSSTVPRRAVPRPHGEPSRPGRRLRQSNASSVEPKATQALLLTVRGRCRKGCDQFQSLTPGQVKILSQKRWVSRRKLQVLATRLADGELLILVTDSLRGAQDPRFQSRSDAFSRLS